MFDYEEEYNYANFELSFDDAKDRNIQMLEIKSNDGKNLIVDDNEELETVYLDNNSNVWYKDGENWIPGTSLIIENNDLAYNVNVSEIITPIITQIITENITEITDLNNVTHNITYYETHNITHYETHYIVNIGDEIDLYVSDSFEYFGTEVDKANPDDLIIGGYSFGTRDENVLLTDGTIIEEPENNLEDDTLSFSMPDEQVKMLLKVGNLI